jgi:ABC-type nitrate/sulfonate/bicarbonate transport system permease component
MGSGNEISRGINSWKIVRFVFLPSLVIVLWYVATLLELFSPAVLPSPIKVVISFYKMIVSKELFQHIGISLLRVFYGMVAATTLGIPLGIFMGLSQKFEELVNGLLTIVRPIPPLAWIPLALLWFGIGNMSVVFIVCLSSFFAVLLNTIAGVKSVDRVLIRAAASLGSDQKILITKVILPASIPSIFTGFRIAIGVSWMSIVAAELVGSSSGLGYMIQYYREVMRSDIIIVGMITIGILGFLMDWGLKKLENLLLPWRIGLRRR